MQRRWLLAMLGGALVAASFSTVADGKGAARPLACGSYKGASTAAMVTTFSSIEVTRIGCGAADQVLHAFGKTGPTGLTSYLGYVCHASKTKLTHVEAVKCSKVGSAISARETQLMG